MSRVAAIYRRELTYFYNSIIAYVVTMVFVLLAGYFFYSLVGFFSLASLQVIQNPMAAQRLSLTEGVLRPFFANLSVVLVLIVPLLTMRLLAEEQKMGTAELLFTYPISEWHVILGKYFAALSVVAVMLALTLVLPLFLEARVDVEWGAVLTGYLGLFSLGLAYVALGLFFSAISENQIVAAVLTFGVSLLVLLIGWVTPFVSAGVARVVSEISILEHFEGFSKGVIDTNDVVYYLNFSALFLFLCSRILESNRWRG
jgi:ABC-2 type transport system permease protein